MKGWDAAAGATDYIDRESKSLYIGVEVLSSIKLWLN